MKKGILRIFAAAVFMVLVFGVGLIACDTGTASAGAIGGGNNNDGNGDGNNSDGDFTRIIVTEIPENYVRGVVIVTNNSLQSIAIGGGQISNGYLTVVLQEGNILSEPWGPGTTAWNGRGSYIIQLSLSPADISLNNRVYLYTAGQPYNGELDWPDFPRFNIARYVSTISFDRFDAPF